MKRDKMIRLFGLVTAAALAMTLFLPGCGGSSGGKNGAAYDGAASSAPQAAPAEPAAPAPSPGMNYSYMEAPEEDVPTDSETAADASGEMPQFQMPDSRKIIRHLSMDLETREFTDAIQSIQSAVAQAGGYIESQNQEGYSLGSRSRYQERYANIQARVPSAKLDEVARSVGGFCNVLSQSESMDDITDSYYDAQAHLKSLQLQEERLLAILEKADKLEDIITLESALSDVRYQIESLTASLRRMDSQVTYSYLNISLREVVEYQEVQEKPRTFGERISEAFGDGIGDLVDGLQSFALFLARTGPSLVVLIAIVAVIVLIVRAASKASAKRREAKGIPPRPAYNGTTQPSKFEAWYPQTPQAPQPPAQPPVPPEKPQEEPKK